MERPLHPEKSPEAFRTISEVASLLSLPQHVLRFWETRFGQIRPLKRGGGRRFYRVEDVALLKGIQYLLYKQGYTIKGVQKLMKAQGPRFVQGLAEPQAEIKVARVDREVEAPELNSPPPAVAATGGAQDADIPEPHVLMQHDAAVLPLFQALPAMTPVRAESREISPAVIAELRRLREELVACRDILKQRAAASPGLR